MKTISGIATFLVGLVVAVYGFNQESWLLIGVGLVVVYTGYRVLKSKKAS